VIEADADAVLAASTLHYGTFRVRDIKRAMAAAGVPVRLVDVPDDLARPAPLTWKE